MDANCNYNENFRSFTDSQDMHVQEIASTQVYSSSIKINTNSDCSVIFITTASLQGGVSQQCPATTESSEEESINKNNNKPLRGDSMKKLKNLYDSDQGINAYSTLKKDIQEIVTEDDRSTIYSVMDIQEENSHRFAHNDSELYKARELASSLGGICKTKTQSYHQSAFEFTCNSGHSFTQTLDSAKQNWCPKCNKKLKLIQDYASLHNGRVLSKIYDQSIDFQCQFEHRWTISVRNAKKKWCRQCEKEERNKRRQDLEEEYRQQQMKYEEEQKMLFEQARLSTRAGSCFETNSIPKSQPIFAKPSIIEHFETIEREIFRIAMKKTSEYLASNQDGKDCSQEQIFQVYSVLLTPEEILKRYMSELSTECLRSEYKRLAKLLHPDKNRHPKAGGAFQKISKVYESALMNFNLTF